MTSAFLVASAYPKAQAYPTLETAARSGDMLALELLEAHPDLDCQRLHPVPRLAANLKAQIVALDQRQSVFVYCAGHLVLTPDGQPALLIDGELVASVPTERLLRAAASHGRALFVWDCMLSAAVPGASGTAALGRAVNMLIDEHQTHGYGAIVALRSWTREPDASTSPLCRALAAVLRTDPSARRTASTWVSQIQASHAARSEIEHFACCPPSIDFNLFESEIGQAYAGPKGRSLRSSPPPIPPVAPSVAPSRGFAVEDNDPPTQRRLPVPSVEPWARQMPLADAPHPASDLITLQALLDALQRDGLHVDAMQTARQCAMLARTAAERCLYLSVAAGLAKDSLGRPDWAVTIAEQALELAPGSAEALHLVSSVLDAEGRWERLVALYEQLLEQGMLDPAMTTKVGLALARVCRLRLADRARARKALQRALELAPGAERLHHELASLFEEEGSLGSAFEHYQAALDEDPLNPENYRRAYAFSVWSQELDRAYQAASALVHLGHADEEAARHYGEHAPTSLLAVQSTLKPPVWEQGLLYPERDPLVAKLLQTCVRAVRELGVANPKQHKRELDGLMAQDAPSSTTTLARTLLWCTHLIGVLPPQLYLQEEPGGIRVARTPLPTVVASKAMASGFSLPQLAFLWGRGLAPLRPEHQLYVWHSTPESVHELLLSLGSALGLTDSTEPGVRKLAKGLKRELTAQETSELTELGQQLDWSKSSEHASGWVRSVELASIKLGLVCSGDLALSAELVQRFPLPGAVGAAEQRTRLLQFAMSDHYAALRDALGVRRPSQRPPESARSNGMQPGVI